MLWEAAKRCFDRSPIDNFLRLCASPCRAYHRDVKLSGSCYFSISRRKRARLRRCIFPRTTPQASKRSGW